MSLELVRKRTDTLLLALTGGEYNLDEYITELGVVKSDLDAATLAVASEPPPYSMRDLDQPIEPSTMVIPQDMNAFLSGHTKISTSYSGDWPEAEVDNRFGKQQPFHPESNSCPLLHGATHGDPAYCDHILASIDLLPDHRESERRMRTELQGAADIMGDPSESMLDLHNIDRSRFGELSDEGYAEAKRDELRDNFGLLSHLFGLEYQTTEQRDAFMGLLSDLAMTEQDSPEAKFSLNKMGEKAGLSWGRALRNWRDRFTPLAAWWMRPSDKSGPVEPHPDSMAFDRHHSSPWKLDEMGIVPNHNYHWWEPFQHWGGVGRDIGSLQSLFGQTYSKIFNDSWLGELLFHGIPLEGRHSIAGSHFPRAANTEMGQGELAGMVSSDSMADLDFERKRANWSGAASWHHHLHPSEIEGQGSIMVIPHDAYQIAPFGRAMMNVGEHGAPLAPFLGMEHPNSISEFHDLHNNFNNEASNAITREAMRLANIINQQLGSQVLIGALDGDGSFSDVEGNTLARGNIQQVVAAANYSLMKYGDVGGHSVMPLIELSTGEIKNEPGSVGPVAPDSAGVVPPIYNCGNTDAWGHRMPVTLIWKDNPLTSQVEFSLAEQPFNIMQRTAHEGHIRQLDPAFQKKQIRTKDSDIRLLTANHLGYPSLVSDLHKSDDDYEPTGVFSKDMIAPAHIVKDLDDLDTLKGFSGDWIIQAKPPGERMMIEKRGKTVEPRLPNAVAKDLKQMKGDFTVDGYLDDKMLNIVDLLVHKGSDLSFEPLSDRIDVLRTVYHSTENVHFPAPKNCVFSDEGGLVKAIASFDKGEFLLRDSTSTFIKDKELHPKWVLFANDDLSKSRIYPPLPEILVKGDEVILEYPEILSPVIVKLAEDADGIFIDGYEGASYLVKQAQSQEELWIPPVAFVIKEGGGGAVGGEGGGGMLSSTTDGKGTYQPVHSISMKRRKRKVRKAPAVIEEGEEEDGIDHLMRHVRVKIDEAEESLTSDELVEGVEGLTHDHLLRFSGEYGIERTEDNKWTLNEAIDDEIADTPDIDDVEKNVFPRGNRASADGGAWSGMQADITAPMGPTEITDEENTTFGDPREGEDDEREPEKVPNLSMAAQDDVEKPEIEITEDRAIMRFPRRKKTDEDEEAGAQPSIRTDSV